MLSVKIKSHDSCAHESWLYILLFGLILLPISKNTDKQVSIGNTFPVNQGTYFGSCGKLNLS